MILDRHEFQALRHALRVAADDFASDATMAARAHLPNLQSVLEKQAQETRAVLARLDALMGKAVTVEEFPCAS